MAGHFDLLPGSSTPLERLFSETNDPFAGLVDRWDGIRSADAEPPPGLLPFLVWEYGLGELSPYLPNLYALISEGLKWQRERGTPASIARGLGWLGYSATIEEEATRRRIWNRFQIELNRVRDNDFPDLPRINGITSLSPPLRSMFFRGFAGYDVRCAETSYRRTSECILGDHSGVRIEAGKAKWSFGRFYAREYQFLDADLAALGVFLDPVEEGEWGLWNLDERLWDELEIEWAVSIARARINTMAAGIKALPVWVRFADGSGETIGYSLARSHPVAAAISGEYVFDGNLLSTYQSAFEAMFVLANTRFGDGAGSTAASMSLLFDPDTATDLKPGSLWADPDQLSGGVELAPTAIDIEFGLTVRECTRFLLRF